MCYAHRAYGPTPSGNDPSCNISIAATPCGHAVPSFLSAQWGLAEALAELKKHSGEVVNKLAASKQAIEAELTEIRKEARTLSEKLGKANGTADTLRAQVTEQQATIRDLSARREPGGEGTSTGGTRK